MIKRCVKEDILERRGGSEHDLNIRPPPPVSLNSSSKVEPLLEDPAHCQVLRPPFTCVR